MYQDLNAILIYLSKSLVTYVRKWTGRMFFFLPVRKGLLTWRSWGMKRLLACLSTQGRDHWRERKSLMSLFIWPTLLSWGWKSIGCISKFPTVPLNLSHKAGNKKESRVAVSTHSIIPRSNISRYYSITEITFVTEY